MKTLVAAFAAALAVAAAPAQVASTVGPPVAPLGCPIQITISNDTKTIHWTGICPFVVEDENGRPVYTPVCPLIARELPPGSTFTTSWPQIDNKGRPVPAGSYFVEVQLPTGHSERHAITIDQSARAAVANLGVIRPGTTRSLFVCSPSTPRDIYLMAASAAGTTPGLMTCGGRWPLNPDQLFAASLQPNPVFLRFAGFLDGTGASSAPAIALPAIPALRGIAFHVAFVALDISTPCPVVAVSEPLAIVIR